MSHPWTPHPRKADWRGYLTEDERAAIADAEAVLASAKTVAAAAAATITPIRSRALHRRRYAERAAVLKERP